MVEIAKIHIDSKDVEKKLKGTQLRLNTILVKMQRAVNRVVIRKAKQDFRSKFNVGNHNKYTLSDNNKTILQSFKTVKNKKVKGATQIKNTAYYSKFLEFGASIHAKNYKYLTFKINDEWVKVESVELPARPFLGNNLTDVWNSPQAKQIQEETLQKELKKYWEKVGDL